MKKFLLAGAVLALTATSASAAIVTFNYSGGYHTGGWVTGGSNGASINVVYGDGPNYGVSPQNKCVNGAIVQCSALTPSRVNGDNGTYQTNVGGATPMASYVGSLSYDNAITFSYTDQSTNATETWYAVTGGTLAWTGTVGFEVLVAPTTGASGQVGGSFFDYSFANGNVNLTTGVRTSTSKCDLGIAGQAIVGALLCGFANPATSYNYSSSGSYVKPVNWTGVRENGDGSIELLMYGNRYTALGSGNNLQERLTLVPVPAAVWMFGSAIGALGFARRRMRAA